MCTRYNLGLWALPKKEWSVNVTVPVAEVSGGIDGPMVMVVVLGYIYFDKVASFLEDLLSLFF